MGSFISSRGLRLLSLAAGLAALLAFSVGGVAQKGAAAVRSMSGSATFQLTLGHGGSLSGELASTSGAPVYLVEAALLDVGHDGENPGLVVGELSGDLLDAATFRPVGRIEGLFASQGGQGQLRAVVHPLTGPDPWKVDAGHLQGWYRVQGTRSAIDPSVARLHGDVLLELRLNREL